MNKLELPHAKLLYMIAELSKKQYINDAEKRILKCKIKNIKKRQSQMTFKSFNFWTDTKNRKTKTILQMDSSALQKDSLH